MRSVVSLEFCVRNSPRVYADECRHNIITVKWNLKATVSDFYVYLHDIPYHFTLIYHEKHPLAGFNRDLTTLGRLNALEPRLPSLPLVEVILVPLHLS